MFRFVNLHTTRGTNRMVRAKQLENLKKGAQMMTLHIFGFTDSVHVPIASSFDHATRSGNVAVDETLADSFYDLLHLTTFTALVVTCDPFPIEKTTGR